ncbi:MAG: hypothetical protein P8Y71_03470 [Pseudolabrys sp.]
MNAEISAALKTAISLWLKEALDHLQSHAEQNAEVPKAYLSPRADVRMVAYAKGNTISLETIETDDEGRMIFTEVLREEFADTEFMMPEGGMVQ